jgi:monoamine oxidase
MDFDVIIVGAGAAGLTALREFDRAGCHALCLEARDRIGGRVFTIHDPLSPIPIELGAEFVHGRPAEITGIANSGHLALYHCGEHAVHIENGEVQDESDAWELVDEVMDDMQRAASSGPDQSFQSFLERSSHPEEAKRLATAYVEGFNAARKELIGIASLAEDARAAEQIGGNQSLRVRDGYDAIIRHVLQGLDDASAKLRLNSVVESIDWQPGSAVVHVRSDLTGRQASFASRRVLITVPLGVLQAGRIRFNPEPAGTLEAARALAFGQVIRVVLRFREPFWTSNSRLADAGFLLSQEQFFPTWWTPLPLHAPVMTGWSAGPHCDSLLGKCRAEILSHALMDLARITNASEDRLSGLLEAAYFQDWYTDPFARGAYSYVPAGAMKARKKLAEPVSGTLYFAGEAAELNGHSATVHGAMMSGKRAARQILC